LLTLFTIIDLTAPVGAGFSTISDTTPRSGEDDLLESGIAVDLV
jgi:hypothetical protein